jgi:hypothetical protein
MIVFGGFDGVYPYRNDVWALPLAETPAWIGVGSAGTPPDPRAWHTAVYDPVRDRMIVFGGFDGLYYHNDVWALSLAGTPAWTEIVPTGTPPSARSEHTAVYDPARNRMVVFGGTDGLFSYPDAIWALSLAGSPAWTQLAPTGTPPSGREGHTAVYDPVRDRMIVFGGYHGSSYHNDVWALSLAGTPTWTQLAPAGTPPSARSAHTAVYDPVRDRMVVFGGDDGYSFNDVWALSLAESPAWTQLTPTGTPPSARYGHTAVYDPVRDRVVVFGGDDGSAPDDVWALALVGTPAWTQLAPTGTPPSARYGHTAVYDPVRDRMVVFGGLDFSYYSLNDVWALSLSGTSTWVQLAPAGTPPSARYGHTAVYDPARDRMVVFGGGRPNDAWALGWNPLAAVPGDHTELPARFELAPPRPNPSRGQVIFGFALPRTAPIQIVVYDAAGRVIRRVADATYTPGRHSVPWDRRDERGNVAGSGVYFVRLQVPGVLLTRKTVLIR